MAISKKTSQSKEEVRDSVKKESAEAITETVETTLEKKIPAKKAPAKKPAEKKTVTARKTASDQLFQDVNIFVQFNNKETNQQVLVKRIIEKWCTETGKKDKDIKELNIYIKPEDNAAYYVINGQGDSVEL